MSNEDLTELVKQGDKEAAAMLWKQNQGLVFSLIQPWRGYLETEDLIQQAYLGLHYAALNYDGEKGSFTSYLPFWVLLSINRHVADCGTLIRLPEYLRGKLHQRKRRIGELGQMLGREPTPEEITRYVGEASEAEEAGTAALMVDSLDREITDGEGGKSITLAETIADPEDVFEGILDKVRNDELAAVLWPMVDELPPEQGEVIRKHYREGISFREIAADAGISDKGARQREERGLYTLRHKRRASALRDFLDDKRHSKGLKGTSVKAFRRTWTSATEKAAIDIYLKELEDRMLAKYSGGNREK